MNIDHEDGQDIVDYGDDDSNGAYIADMDKYPQYKCCLDKCRGDICNLLYLFPGPLI